MDELIQTFNFDDDFVRVVVDDTNNPLFVAKDVATVLGYSDTTNAIKQHCKGVAKHHPIADRMGRCQEMRVITEPDVYRLVFGSKLETAERFQDWVFNEVLPTIRKTGAYMSEPPRLPQTYLEALRALADEVEAHEHTQQQLAIAEPKVQYFDKLVERNLLTNFTTTAKEFGVKRKDLIDYLLDNGYIYRDQQGNLLPYAVHVPHLFEVKEYCKDHHSGTQTLITPKGRETLRLLLT